MKKDRTDMRIHIMTSRKCNNNCIFCLEDKNIETLENIGKLSTIKEIINRNDIRRINEVLFTGKEPTLNKDLPDMIKLVKDKGYKNISLVTNGRLLSYENYLKKLVINGLNRIIISIHGSNARIHESLTRAPGSFKQTVNGLTNVSKMKERRNISLITATTLNKFNYKDMINILDLLDNFKANCNVFNPVIPREKALANKGVIISYSKLAQEIADELKEKDYTNIRIELPFCLMKGYEKFVGRREGILTITGGLTEEEDNKRKIKGQNCVECINYEKCDGVHKEYTDLFGWGEFKAMKEDQN